MPGTLATPDHAARTVASPAVETIVPVTNCDDASPASPGSLRDVYSRAVDNEVIDLGQLACSRITLVAGALVDAASAANVTLRGPGRDRLAIDGGGHGRVLAHFGGGVLRIEDLTITNGQYIGVYGGCIYSRGNVEASRSTVSSCVLSTPAGFAAGGGIYARGAVRLTASAVIGNTASAAQGGGEGGGVHCTGIVMSGSVVSGNTASRGKGGGILVGAAGVIDIEDSTISGNNAYYGGGLFDFSSAALHVIKNSTISGNSAQQGGAGVFSYYPLNIYNSTIARNTMALAAGGAGVFIYGGGNSTLQSTIIGNNLSGGGLFEADLRVNGGSHVSGSSNLVMTAVTDAASSVALIGTITADPALAATLQDNGGPTPTLALLAPSPAIDRGSNVLQLSHDQRGGSFTRVDGAKADIGAFEFSDRIFSNGLDPPS